MAGLIVGEVSQLWSTPHKGLLLSTYLVRESAGLPIKTCCTAGEQMQTGAVVQEQ
jgi:hypothetical protein